jgi:hypothetical protein
VPLWFRVARIWLPIAVATTVSCGLVAAAVQQSYRSGLNDPQIQLAHDAVARLDAGASAASVVNSPSVDAQASLAPFVIVYSPTNTVLAGGARLDGKAPTPPAGVLQAARHAAAATTVRLSAENRVTWQPRPGVRLASVSVAARNGTVVLAARNMSEVEARISALMLLVAAAWLAAVGAALGVTIVLELLAGRVGRPAST